MYRKIIICAIVLAVSVIFNGSVAWMMQGNYHNEANPGKCTFSEYLILSPGEESKIPNRCAVAYCYNEDGEASTKGCGALGAPPNCKWTDYEDVNAPYPLCCVKKFECADPADIPEALALQTNKRNMFERQIKKRN